MNKTLLAFDLGAGSGRAILGRFDGSKLTIEQIHRFANEPVRYNGELHWDAPRLWFEMETALGRVGAYTEHLESVGVDTWGVDYALLGERGNLLENPFHYRDARTVGRLEEVCRRIGRETLYDETGLQFMELNTLIQLYAAAQQTPELLRHAKAMLLMPDLFHYWLSGTLASEYTIASTTQMLSRKTKTWGVDLLRSLGLPGELPQRLVQPGTAQGCLPPELAAFAGLKSTQVIAPACHDTASAVAAVSNDGATAFLSSGTWSLLGAEVSAPVVNADSLRLNFTNEGGASGTSRLLKNITGLWLLEGCRKMMGAEGQYNALMATAGEAKPLLHLVDPDASDFRRPSDMTRAIDDYCVRTGQAPPRSAGAYARGVLESLALKYRITLAQLEHLTGTRYARIRVMGGGSQNTLLNQFTADATGRQVLAGPVEATALGNLGLQMMGSGLIDSLGAMREMIARSFPSQVFEPSGTGAWDAAYRRFQQYCDMSNG